MSMPTSRLESENEFARRLRTAERALAAADTGIAGVLERNGPLDGASYPARSACAALAWAIIGQQLSTRAAATITARVTTLCENHVTAPALLTVGFEGLRTAGVSGAKAKALLALAQAMTAGTLPLEDLATHADDAQIAALLCSLPGIGPWTAQMFLMFGLRRLDVYAPGDLGLRKAIALMEGLDPIPTPAACAQRAELWRPWRTVASWHLWRSLSPANPAPRPAVLPPSCTG